MKNYKKTKERIAFYLEKPNYNKYSSDCNIDESIRGIIDECRNILDLQDIVKTLAKSSERKACKPRLKHQIIDATIMALNIRYEYLEQFIKNIKQATKND